MSLPHYNITGKIIAAAMEVHNEIGCGYQEIIYQRALYLEMANMGLSFIREYEMEVCYKGKEVGLRRVDFFVEDVVLVELKAVSQLEKVHLAQALNYVEAMNLTTGLLINFGTTSLQFKRLINNKRNPNSLSFP